METKTIYLVQGKSFVLTLKKEVFRIHCGINRIYPQQEIHLGRVSRRLSKFRAAGIVSIPTGVPWRWGGTSGAWMNFGIILAGKKSFRGFQQIQNWK
jgi:hypothetical protein